MLFVRIVYVFGAMALPAGIYDYLSAGHSSFVYSEFYTHQQGTTRTLCFKSSDGRKYFVFAAISDLINFFVKFMKERV